MSAQNNSLTTNLDIKKTKQKKQATEEDEQTYSQ
jgi:hypothetical protein